MNQNDQNSLPPDQDAPRTALTPTEIERPEARTTLPVRFVPRIEHDGRPSAGGHDGDAPHASSRSFRVSPAFKVAAVIAVATAFGALAGSLAANRATTQWLAEADAGATKATVAQLQQDITSLRTSLEASASALQTQTQRLGERLDRSDKAQADTAQRLVKVGDTLERIERRTAQAATPAPAPVAAAASGARIASADVTGSIPAAAAAPPEPPVLKGWVVRDVRRGMALIEGRYGLVGVEPGDQLPGVGRIDTIQKQDGRWVVTTSRGVIVQR